MPLVPDTNTFSLQDIVNATGGTSLNEAFNNSVTGNFDARYGSKTMSPKMMLGFRNYKTNLFDVTLDSVIATKEGITRGFASAATLTNYSGIAIISRGFVYATHSHPTISDLVSSGTVGGNPAIFYDAPDNSSSFIITPNTTYHVRAFAQMVAGNYIYSSNELTVVSSFPVIGELKDGGIIAYVYAPGDPGYVSGQFHGIIASLVNTGGTSFYWDPYVTHVITGATSDVYGGGLTNTGAIINALGLSLSYAASVCYTSVLNGYEDWSLPDIVELQRLYVLGIYGKGNFTHAGYWSSTEDGADYALTVDFGADSAGVIHTRKSGVWLNVRAIRYF